MHFKNSETKTYFDFWQFDLFLGKILAGKTMRFLIISMEL